MKNGERDNQRSKLYKAENTALRPIETNFETIKATEKFLNKCCEKATLIKRYGSVIDLKNHPIKITDGRGTTNALAHGDYKISLPSYYGTNWARTDRVSLHELAHIIHNRITNNRKYASKGIRVKELSGGASHGWQFAAIYLDLVRFCMGKEAEEKLKKSFRENNVRFSPKSTRKITDETRKALRQRISVARAARKR